MTGHDILDLYTRCRTQVSRISVFLRLWEESLLCGTSTNREIKDLAGLSRVSLSSTTLQQGVVELGSSDPPDWG
ncbi:unnamed protein product [Lasius platythorax]|uniref:Uncharacterized protein n=1 Tax=Lasius platythorax TaxID=488582 RepID=A0AAV2P8E7_9HYME